MQQIDIEQAGTSHGLPVGVGQGHQMLKLSPQPHSPLTFGFLNWKA